MRAARLGALTWSSRGLLSRRYSSSTVEGTNVSRTRLWRWGATQGGMMSQQEAVEVSKEPTLVEGVQGVTAIACGSNNSAFVAGGQLFTYGSNKHDQLGRETNESETASFELGKVAFEAPDGHRPQVLKPALGAFHAAAITEGGALWTWGWGGSFWYGVGALGHGHRESLKEPTIVQRLVELGEEVVQVTCGSQHTLILTREGRLFSTGKGDFGRLGRGDTSDEPEFEEIEYFTQANDSVLNPHEPTNIVKIDAGDNFSAALSQNGELWVWGRNDYGQLGLGEEAMGDMYSAERYPRLVRSLPLEGHRVVDFACGKYHLVALTASGSLYEWGNRTWLEPHPVSLPARYEEGLKDIMKVAAGDKFSFALTRDGHLFSWGLKSSGCLAQGEDCPKNIVEPTPVPTESFSHQRIVDIAASNNRCLAITEEGEYVS